MRNDLETLRRLFSVCVPPSRSDDQDTLARDVLSKFSDREELIDASLLSGQLTSPFDSIAAFHLRCVASVASGRLVDAFGSVRRSFDGFGEELARGDPSIVWAAPLLPVLLRVLRTLAVRCDASSSVAASDDSSSDGGCVGQAVGAIGKIVGLASRAPALLSVAYPLVNDLLQLCLMTRSFELAVGALAVFRKTVMSSPQLELDAVPRAHSVKFSLLHGTQLLLRGSIAEADQALSFAFEHARAGASSLKAAILAKLIPCRLSTRDKLPPRTALQKYHLWESYGPVLTALSRGDVASFDAELDRGAQRFARLGVYIALERCRLIAWRNLARRVSVARAAEFPGDKVPKLPFAAIVTAAGMLARRHGTTAEHIDTSDVACAMANLIYEKLLSGYISLQHSLVVLSATNAFPRRGDFIPPSKSPMMS